MELRAVLPYALSLLLVVAILRTSCPQSAEQSEAGALHGRRLQFENLFQTQPQFNGALRGRNGGGRRGRGRKEKSGQLGKAIRSEALTEAVSDLEMNSDRYHLWWTGPPDENLFKPAEWGAMHQENQNSIFTMAVIQGLQDVHLSHPHDLILFLGTARKVLPDGDIVMAVEGGQSLTVEKKNILKHYKAVVYEIPEKLCSKATGSIFCGNADERVPASVFRYYFYEKWAANYNHDSLLMLADFRDLLFQSNPFAFHVDSWYPQHQLVVFQEFYPNMVINRCRFNRRLMQECYGDEALRQYGRETIISSGAIMGTRDAILVWSHQVSSQLQEAPGRLVESSRCTSGGVDHAFVNWLVHGQKLRNLLRVKVFLQGDGAVNSLGGLNPDTVAANLTGSLEQYWKVLNSAGEVLNWSGEVSPVVHQLDHFIEELEKIVDKDKKEHNDLERGWQAISAARCLWGCKTSIDFSKIA